MKFLFQLRDVRDITPWRQSDGTRQLDWFGISDGGYCIETSAGRFLEHQGKAAPGLIQPWCDYQVARLFYDVATVWPTVSNAIPDDIVDYFHLRHRSFLGTGNKYADLWDAYSGWYDQQVKTGQDRGDDFWDTFYDASGWWSDRHIDTLYLKDGPDLQLWRTRDEIHLAWDAKPPWMPSRARLTLSFDEAHRAVASFFTEFVSQMDERVRLIEQHGWYGQDCDVDIYKLMLGQAEAQGIAHANLTRSRPTDWDQVRRALTQF